MHGRGCRKRGRQEAVYTPRRVDPEEVKGVTTLWCQFSCVEYGYSPKGKVDHKRRRRVAKEGVGQGLKGPVKPCQKASNTKKQAEKNLTPPLTTSIEPSAHPASRDSVAHAMPKIGTGMSVDAKATMEPKKKNSGRHVTCSCGATAGQSTGSDKTVPESSQVKKPPMASPNNDHYSAVESPEQQDKSGNDSNDSIIEVMALEGKQTCYCSNVQESGNSTGGWKQNGKRSRKMKEVKVVVTNRDDKLPSTDSHHQIKTCRKVPSLAVFRVTAMQIDKGPKAKLFHENKVEAQKTISNTFSCDIHSLPDKPTLCWKDPGATLMLSNYRESSQPLGDNAWLPPLPNPVLAKTDVPRIGPWLEYCNMHCDRQGEDFSKHADKFNEEGYCCINQLLRDHMSEEKLSNWLNIGKGTANLLIQYATEDMELVNTGRFSMVG
ncbi:hypothetical protein F5148DRAFT_1151908 [Russula earlei]|uniref:Uncharacterized protein n=1 Tax=Russula earlei TaxID=71964 RepID=A0ACC0TZK0_9AGAM|nr:hypothetical protein F5148DRAFT_1151908 [Russula earlei]